MATSQTRQTGSSFPNTLKNQKDAVCTQGVGQGINQGRPSDVMIEQTKQHLFSVIMGLTCALDRLTGNRASCETDDKAGPDDYMLARLERLRDMAERADEIVKNLGEVI